MAGGMRLIFVVDDNLLLRITHGLSNGRQNFARLRRPRNERKLRKRRRPIDRKFCRVASEERQRLPIQALQLHCGSQARALRKIEGDDLVLSDAVEMTVRTKS